jgi:hypothetical protein
MKRSAAQERAVAGDYRGQRTPGSGSGWRLRGDVRNHAHLFECKSTENRTQITIKLADLHSIERRALASDRVPVLTFDINGERYHVFTDADTQEMIGDLDGGT